MLDIAIGVSLNQTPGGVACVGYDRCCVLSLFMHIAHKVRVLGESEGNRYNIDT